MKKINIILLLILITLFLHNVIASDNKHDSLIEVQVKYLAYPGLLLVF